MAKYVSYQYGSQSEHDQYTAYMMEGGKVFRVTRVTGQLPVREPVDMTASQYRDLPYVEDRL